ncbi:MAG: hypothetical protein UT34_C0002G0298 [candidate division WS6 bacterium GW2011_GWF2_39_15]|uniref:Uncharacterized protein n=1 Tax=candidate division WS6 bacterium GW2011_GWF2_39_15 TaxID=1619100 RepID=A0A0G0MYZ8_9BACT|nr:MAG: hypothetical protein UT34_C0002G0298 [candidate division WS6 bacterium GW2011_GWF2_39_15]
MQNFLSRIQGRGRILILVLIVLIGIFLLSFVIVKIISNAGKVVETNGQDAEVLQAYTSVSTFGYDTSGGSNYNTAGLQYSTVLNMSTSKEIAGFEIRNVKLSDEIESEKIFITWPKHFGQGKDNNTFYEDMGTKADYPNRKDEGNKFEYRVVDSAAYTDEIGVNGGVVDFRYTLFGIGNKFDYEEILDNDKVYKGGKELVYAGVKKEDIDSSIEFDVIITFTDKSKAVKHFSLNTNFDEVLNQGFSFVNNGADYIGKKF